MQNVHTVAHKALARDAPVVQPVVAHEAHAHPQSTSTFSTETITITYDAIATKTFPKVDATAITIPDGGVSVQSGSGYDALPTGESYGGLTDAGTSSLITFTGEATATVQSTILIHPTFTVTMDALTPTSGPVAPAGDTASAGGADTSITVPADAATLTTSTVTRRVSATTTTTVTALAPITTSGGTASSASPVRDGLSGLGKVFMLAAAAASVLSVLSMPLV